MLQFLHIFSKQFFSLDEHRILFESHHLYDKSFLHIFNNLIHLSVLFGIPITLQKAIKLDFHLIHNSVGNMCIRRPRPFRYWNNLYEDRIAYQMDMCHSTICAPELDGILTKETRLMKLYVATRITCLLFDQRPVYCI